MKILKAIYEESILHKLGYSSKFPRKVLYMWKNALGTGLLCLKTIIETLALKLYIRYKREKIKIHKLITIIEDMHFVESRYKEEVLE